MSELPFRFIGHPMIDVGVATLCAAADVDDPRRLTPSAVDAFTQEITDLYLNPAMSNYLFGTVFGNAYFVNASIDSAKFGGEKRKHLVNLLNLWKDDVQPIPGRDEAAQEDEVCTFSGDPAKIRASIEYVPMTTDRSKINFVPEGVPGLPVSGWCLLALLVMPLGGLNASGKLWIAHSPSEKLTLQLAKSNLRRNRLDFQLQGLAARPNYRFARTHLIKDMSQAQLTAMSSMSLTCYCFSSKPRTSGASIEITHLPSPVIRFIRLANKFAPDAWNRIVRRAERLNADPENEDGRIVYTERNYLYEDLFNLPANAHAFLRRYILRTPLSGKPSGEGKNDPRYTYSSAGEAELVSWTLTDLFLEEVLQMEKDRIEAIRAVADRLANYIQTQDERLFRDLFNARNEYQLRTLLIKADKNAQPPLFTLDEFVEAFFTTTDKETLRSDWSLARDLMVIRIIEKLYEGGKVEIVQEAAVEDDVIAEAE